MMLLNFIYKNYKFSYSQIFQDLFVIFLLNKKKNGFFIEIGVGNGIDFSNTFLLLEKNIIGKEYYVNLTLEILKI